MKTFFKKITAYVLILALIMTMNTSVFAATETAPEEVIIDTHSETYINPIYADVISENDLKEFSGEPIATLSDIEYETDEVAIVDAIREAMINREGNFTLYYTQNSPLEAGYLARWIEAATAENSSPSQGDYLKFQLGECGVSTQTAYYPSSGKREFTFNFSFTYYTSAEQEEAVNNAVASVMTQLGLPGNYSDYEKAQKIYDYICENVTYDNENLDNDEYTLKYTAYAASIDKTAVCQGYANLMYRLLREAGVSARIISGTGNDEPHAWNIIKVGSNYYYADATWDAGKTTYDWFLKGSADFSNHVNDEEYTNNTFVSDYPVSRTDCAVTASGTCGDNLNWMIESNRILTISGSGPMYDFKMGALPWETESEEITSIVISDGVTSIGACAFCGFFDLTSVSLPNSLTSIGKQAFYGTSALYSINIPDSVTSIGTGAFEFSSNLTKVKLPNGLDTISVALFDQCNKLASIDIPDSVTSIGSYAFSNCEALTSVEIPDSVTSIGNNAFQNCTALKSAVFPDSLTSIEENIISGCTKFQKLYFRGSKEKWTALTEGISLGQYIFDSNMVFNATDCDIYGHAWIAADCDTPKTCDTCGTTEGDPLGHAYGEYKVVTTATFGSAGTERSYCENNCGDYKERQITIIDSGTCGDNATWTLDIYAVLTISGTGKVDDNSGYIVYKQNYKKIVIEEGITELGANSFERSNVLTEIKLPDTLTVIGDYAFAYCGGPDTVALELPENLTTIGNHGLYGLYFGSVIVIPESVTDIEDDAFNAEAIRYIVINNKDCQLGNINTNSTPITFVGYAGSTAEVYAGIRPNSTFKTICEYNDVDHAWTSQVIQEAPTCSLEGTAEVTCMVCSKTEKVSVPATGQHIFTNYVSNNDATCSADGTKTAVCDNKACNAKDTVADLESMVDHIYGDWYVAEYATADKAGSEHRDCINCDAFEARECNVAAEYDCENGTGWTMTSDGVMTITGTREVGANSGVANVNKQVRQVIIGEGITEISDNAFADCTSLEQIVIPSSVKTIGSMAFAGCTSLKKIIGYGGSPAEEIAAQLPGVEYVYICEYKEQAHEWTEWTEADVFKEPTCVESGKASIYCTACNKKDVVMIPATEEHSPAVLEAVEATCTESGWTEGSYCEECEAILVAPEERPMIDHECEPVITEFAGFGKAGNIDYLCIYCKTLDRSEEIAAAAAPAMSSVSATFTGNSVKKPVVTVPGLDKEDYSVYVPTMKNVGRYVITVSLNSEYYNDKVSVYFEVKPKGTTISKLTKGKKSFTVKWKKPKAKYLKQTSGYEIRYSLKKSMAGAKIKTVKKTKTTSLTIKKLKAKKKYYVQIRTYKTVNGKPVYSSWSAKKYVKTK